MGEVFGGHEIVSLDGRVDIVLVDSNCYPHEHVLRALDDLSIQADQIRSLKCAETKVIVVEIAIVMNSPLQSCQPASNLGSVPPASRRSGR